MMNLNARFFRIWVYLKRNLKVLSVSYFLYICLFLLVAIICQCLVMSRAIRLSFFVVCLLFVFFISSMERIVISHVKGTNPDHLTIDTPQTCSGSSANGNEHFTKSRSTVINFPALRDAHGHCRFFEMPLRRLQ